tara:strand:- start:2 stop:478 length:477 start_codon:yes stop_codon:yes gene_type:complete
MNNILSDLELRILGLRYGLFKTNMEIVPGTDIGHRWPYSDISRHLYNEQYTEYKLHISELSEIEIQALLKLTLLPHTSDWEKPLTTADILFICKQIYSAKLEVDILITHQARLDAELFQEQENKRQAENRRRQQLLLRQLESDTRNRIQAVSLQDRVN